MDRRELEVGQETEEFVGNEENNEILGLNGREWLWVSRNQINPPKRRKRRYTAMCWDVEGVQEFEEFVANVIL